MDVEIICLLYNAERYVLDLDNSIRCQRKINIVKINYYVTESNDDTIKILNENNIRYKVIKKSEFSHSLTREKALFNVSSRYAVMISQDIKFNDELCIYKLVRFCIINGLSLAYLRQVSGVGLDKYYRMVSYPNSSYVYGYNDLKLGMDACFCSDACSCYDVYDFIKLNGYGKDLNTNEDMFYAYKCLINGLFIGYCSSSYVIHEHSLSIKEIYNRYKGIGVFLKNNNEIAKLKSNKIKYLKIIILILKDFNIIALVKFPFDVMIRFLGIYIGKRQDDDNKS